MTLAVDTPDPPTLEDQQDPGPYEAVDQPDEWTGDDGRRAELAALLRDGAWDDAFAEWSEHTLLTEAEFAVVLDHGLIEGFDFFWNEAGEDVGYRAPELPAGVRRDPIESGDVDAIDAELDDLGRAVSEALENDYIHRDPRQFGFFQDR